MAATFALAVSAAEAADVGITLGGGTTGPGLHLAFPVAQTVNLRVGVNGFCRNFDAKTYDLNHRVKTKLNTFDALVDWYPFGNTFRFSSGLMLNKSRTSTNAKPNGNGTYTLNGSTYSAASMGDIDGRIEFRRIAPYLGVGWGNAVATARGWNLSADLGLMFQGSPRTALNSSGCTASTAICAQMNSDIERESSRLANEVRDYRVYPVLRIGATYNF